VVVRTGRAGICLAYKQRRACPPRERENRAREKTLWLPMTVPGTALCQSGEMGHFLFFFIFLLLVFLCLSGFFVCLFVCLFW
jgi:hypothetical protein